MRSCARRGRTPALVHQLLTDRSGAAIVEAALVLPLLVLLSLGALETARAVAAKAAINHAVKETARYAAVRGLASTEEATQADLETRAVELSELSSSSVTASVSWNPDNSPGGTVTVQLQHTFTPIALPFLPDTMTLSSTASMTVIR